MFTYVEIYRVRFGKKPDCFEMTVPEKRDPVQAGTLKLLADIAAEHTVARERSDDKRYTATSIKFRVYNDIIAFRGEQATLGLEVSQAEKEVFWSAYSAALEEKRR